MIELLALPGWQAPPTSLDQWVAQLSESAGPVTVTRESTGVSWLEVAPLRLRGYAVIAGQRVEAINFELTNPEFEPAMRAVEAAARALRWDVHPDEADDDDELDEDI
jgi:hypothetical protein